jgi:cell division protein FtsZ
MFEIIDQPMQEGAVIKVIGIGGCGGNAVEHMISRGLCDVEFLCANTDAQALKRSTAGAQLQLGAALTRGLGAGEAGSGATAIRTGPIAEMIEAPTCCSSPPWAAAPALGAAPVIADIAKSMNILTVAVVTRPFRLRRQADEGRGPASTAREARRLVDHHSNDKLMECWETISMLDAYAAANDVLHGAVPASRGDQQPGLVNVDFADVRAVMGGSAWR